ncbi:hypothetical protein FRAHR75_300082 [Frankia sp. Hr75.2]|nr:hypothetical protein FRAHR75_300082 [Frankia sp. Hr75.2]
MKWCARPGERRLVSSRPAPPEFVPPFYVTGVTGVFTPAVRFAFTPPPGAGGTLFVTAFRFTRPAVVARPPVRPAPGGRYRLGSDGLVGRRPYRHPGVGLTPAVTPCLRVPPCARGIRRGGGVSSPRTSE